MKSIAILGTRGIPAAYGGFETFAEEIAVRLARRGHRVTVYCEARDEGEPAPREYKGVQLEYVRAPKLGPLTTILFDLLCLVRARKDHDVVYMLGYGSSLFCFLPRLWGRTVWINMDGIEWARSKWSGPARLYLRMMEKIATLTPDRLIADAEGIRTHLEERHRSLPPCTMIPYGAPVLEAAPDPALLSEWELHPDGYYIVVCRLEPENHVLEIVEGFSRSSSPHPLIVLGNHRSGTTYVERVLGAANERVRFIGTVYDQAKLQALRYHARAYFHGHSVGGTNPSLLEAMGCGNAIVAHDNRFNREVAAESAVYFSGAADLPGVVSELERDEARRERMRRAATRRISERYSWDLITDAYEALLEGREG